jgi:hypothetical protein
MQSIFKKMNTEALVFVLAGMCHWIFWDCLLSVKKKQKKRHEYQDMKLLIYAQLLKQGYTIIIYLLYLLNYLFTNLLTPWSRVLLEKLTGPQLVKTPEFYGTRKFITAVTSARHLSLS